MRNLGAILEEIRLCKTSDDNEKLSPLFTELEIAVLDENTWPSTFFEGILELQQNHDFRSLEDSWTLLRFLNNNWEQLSPKQREQLRDVLTEGFDKYQNWMGAFVTSELLGERYADEGALDALADLGENAPLPARAVVPHGLETLAKITPHESLRSLAIALLRELQKSDSEEVRQEALISLRKLGY